MKYSKKKQGDGVVRPASQTACKRRLALRHEYPLLAAAAALKLIQAAVRRAHLPPVASTATKRYATAAEARSDLLGQYIHFSDVAREKKRNAMIAMGIDPDDIDIENDVSYSDWCAAKIQAVYRGHFVRRFDSYMKTPICHLAATTIQRAYRQYVLRWKMQPAVRNEAAAIIQGAWRRRVDRRVYLYFRDLISQKQNMDAIMLLKHLSPQEARIVDNHCGMVVRFRLGGTSFPPLIYYKVFTTQKVTDMNAFSPRDYTRERATPRGPQPQRQTLSLASPRKNPEGWYRRWENNGWRPIAEKLMTTESDSVTERTSNKRIVYHHSKLLRQVDVLRKRKQKKLQWLKKMYSDHPAAKHDGEERPEGRTSREQREIQTIEKLFTVQEQSDEVFGEWEAEADLLLDWTSKLNFEDYQDTWRELATARSTDSH